MSETPITILAGLSRKVIDSYETLDKNIQHITDKAILGVNASNEELDVGRALMDEFVSNITALRSMTDDILGPTTETSNNEKEPSATRH